MDASVPATASTSSRNERAVAGAAIAIEKSSVFSAASYRRMCLSNPATASTPVEEKAIVVAGALNALVKRAWVRG